MQGSNLEVQGIANHKLSEKHIPLTLKTDWEEACPTALSAYKILCDFSALHPHTNNCIEITHQVLAKGLNRPLHKSMCALNCLERMGCIKIHETENELKNCFANKIELILGDQHLQKIA